MSLLIPRNQQFSSLEETGSETSDLISEMFRFALPTLINWDSWRDVTHTVGMHCDLPCGGKWGHAVQACGSFEGQNLDAWSSAEHLSFVVSRLLSKSQASFKTNRFLQLLCKSCA